jgi:hypothetical protein
MVILVFVMIYAVAISVLFINLAVRGWRHSGPFFSRWLNPAAFTQEFRQAIDRGLLMGGLGHGFLALLILLQAIGGGGKPRTELQGVVMTIDLILVVVSFVLFTSVMWLNWPSLVVPPHLRNEPGMWAVRRRGWRDRHGK